MKKLTAAMTKYLPALSPLRLIILITLLLSGTPLLAATYQECLLRTLEEGNDNLTLGEIKAFCQAEQTAATDRTTSERPLPEEKSTPESIIPVSYADLFLMGPHKQNYILLYSHNKAPNTTPYQTNSDVTIDPNEITFQVSLKFPITSFPIGNKRTYLMAAYTAQSFWQAYNRPVSSPFRETNHEPEVFAIYPLDMTIPGARRVYLMGGFVHQSNGRSQPLSRSWNRLYLDFVVEGDNFKISLKPWYRIPEEDKDVIGASAGDDNPDISDYLGYGEISGAFKAEDHTLSFMLRNNLDRHDNKGALKLGWSFKVPFIKADNVKAYIQYFNGYGESLIDYNAAVERIGIGLMIADWL
ncbi:MAG: phospholipase A [Proteobacteria bacterium]|nr:phospholipase A [Pseudomonadota bacterium]MBU1454871.1 phospholipase A [Pseudomonadota bacterium]